MLAIALPRSPVGLQVLAVLGFGFVVWLSAQLRLGSGHVLHWNGGGARYTFIPYVMLAWSLLLTAGTAGRTTPAQAFAVMLGMILLVSGSAFAEKDLQPTRLQRINGSYFVSHPPRWTHTLKSGQLRIRERPPAKQ